MFERDGRRMRLTPQALELLERARPLVAELRALSRKQNAGMSLALSESLAASWGPSVIQTARARMSHPNIHVHVESGALALESVRLGRTDMALCTTPKDASDMIAVPIIDEPMVLAFSKFQTTFDPSAPLILIEPSTATWLATVRALESRHAALLAGHVLRVESFTLMLQMIKAGFGNGVIPIGHVTNVPYRALTGVHRPIRLHARKTAYPIEGADVFCEHLARAAVISVTA
jgi:DNA-binding transcriptional LysR family regulator